MRHFLAGLTLFAFAVGLQCPSTATAKPLKVFILCGQSNMEGHAQTKTFPAIEKDPKTADLYEKMVDAEGNPVVCEDVYVAYAYGNYGGVPGGSKSGNLTAGWGSQHHVGTGKIGPEFTFGITMQEKLDEPILLIKTAWGGKSLMIDFRPPSAGELPEDFKPEAKEIASDYYDHMMGFVKKTLDDPKAVYPGYDPAEGYEVAGFVWFQGFNDMVGPYPRADGSNNKKSAKDYSEYSRLLACFIRDVRKDLDAPDMPFVTGVLGVGGEDANEGNMAFRQAMAATADMPEFKGNVVNVFTGKYWPAEIDALNAKIAPLKAEASKRSKEVAKNVEDRNERKQQLAKISEELRAEMEKILTEEELFQLDNGISNQGYHYYGSAKFFAQIGEAFAEAILELQH